MSSGPKGVARRNSGGGAGAGSSSRSGPSLSGKSSSSASRRSSSSKVGGAGKERDGFVLFVDGQRVRHVRAAFGSRGTGFIDRSVESVIQSAQHSRKVLFVRWLCSRCCCSSLHRQQSLLPLLLLLLT